LSAGSLSGKVAVVTGGGGGIGRVTALLLAQSGAVVGVVDVDSGKADATAQIVRGYGYECESYAADVSSPDEVADAFSNVRRTIGAPSILVSSAGIQPSGNLLRMDPTTVRRVLDVNLLGSLWVVRAVWDDMLNAGGGSIVLISSVQAHGLFSEPSAYHPSKAALTGLTGPLAVEGGRHNIRVNCVEPGAIATPGIGNLAGVHPSVVNELRRSIPLGRRGRAEEVAHAVHMLCLPGASYMTGSIIRVDGGVIWDHRLAMNLPATTPVYGDPDGHPHE
jgi:NAD(P)-dependent dehydrogenase (short-subunit alcohol dehydrogenase family)